MSNTEALAECWSQAFENLLAASRDSAEFADEKPHGRSRTASLRRLQAAIDEVDKLAALSFGRIPRKL